jgi:hypothetical protein
VIGNPAAPSPMLDDNLLRLSGSIACLIGPRY